MNDKFDNQKETLVSLSHEINLLQQQVKYLLRNGKAAELLDLDVLMNRTHTIYDMICSISVGENDEEQDFDIDPEALTALFGGMAEDDEVMDNKVISEEVMDNEVMSEEVMDEEDAAASRHCEEERRSNPEEKTEENTDEKFEEENIEEEVPETDEIQEPEEERRFDSAQRPIEEDVEEGRFDSAQRPEEEEEVQQSEEEKEPIAEEEKQQEGDEFGLFFRFEDIPLREGEVESEEVESGEVESGEVESEEDAVASRHCEEERRSNPEEKTEENTDEKFEEERFDSAQRPEEEEIIEEEQHPEYERTPDMVWDFGPSERVESGEVESGELESEKVESGEVESGEVKSEVVEEIDGKTVHFIEEVSIDEIPEKDRVEGDNLITDNPFEMPAMEDGSPSYGSFFEKDDMGFEISSNETLGESMIDDDNSLNAKYQHAPVNDLKTAIGLNDKFLLVNELFGGSMEKYNKSIDNLNDLKTLNGAMIYLNELKVELQWNSSNEAYKKLWTLVAQKFEGQ